MSNNMIRNEVSEITEGSPPKARLMSNVNVTITQKSKEYLSSKDPTSPLSISNQVTYFDSKMHGIDKVVQQSRMPNTFYSQKTSEFIPKKREKGDHSEYTSYPKEKQKIHTKNIHSTLSNLQGNAAA